MPRSPFQFVRKTPGPHYRPWLARGAGWLLCGWLGGGAAVASGAQVQFVQNACDDVSGNSLAAVASTQWLETGAAYTTVTAAVSHGTFRFVRWSSTGSPAEPYRDAWGRSRNPVLFVLLENTTNTAHYLPAALDADADDVPDWLEREYFNGLALGADDDSDGDGISLLAEADGGTHPLYGNRFDEGGVFRADSDAVSINLTDYARYQLISSPTGTVDQSATVPPGTFVVSPDLFGNAAFGFWTLDGVRQEDVWGVAWSQIEFRMAGSDRTGIAYLFAGDGDGDDVSDAYEQRYFGSLAQDADEDADGDGLSLLAEYEGGSLPHVGNRRTEGGVFWADSSNMTVNLASSHQYRLVSDPAGALDVVETVRDGTPVATPNMAQAAFGFWTLDGEPQRDAWRVALRQFSFVVNGADREGVAHFFTADADGDGIRDGYEQYYFGTLALDADADPDGDDLSLLAEYEGGLSPHIGTRHVEGGVAWADSESLVANLQPFERLRFALVDSVLAEVFSFDPGVVTGWDAGDNAAVALGDWDGDGDLDVFLASDSGLRAFENVGTRRTLDLRERTDRFAALSGWVAEIDAPVLSLEDWNGDGYEDLAIGGQTGAVRLVQSSGGFSAVQPSDAAQTIETGSACALPALGDLNGDDRVDLLVMLADGTARAYLHTGTNSAPYAGYEPNCLGQTVTNAASLGIANVDFSGWADVVVADADGRLWEFFNQGDGTFYLKSKVWAGTHPGFASRMAIAPRDVDGDGDTDVLAGLANGGLIGLRDPRVRRPTGLWAVPGAISIGLSWDPDPQSRIKGYVIYRAPAETGTFARLNAALLTEPRFEDQAVQPGQDYWYYVTGVTEAYYPGNSHAVAVESAASDTLHVAASNGCGQVVLRVKPGRGAPGHNVKIRLVLDEAVGIQGDGLALEIDYPAADLTPRSQTETNQETVVASRLCGTLVLSDDSAAAGGSFRITGNAGETLPGHGVFLTLNFTIDPAVAPGTQLGVVVASAVFRDTFGQPLNVVIVPGGIVDVDGAFVDGDLTGDGVVDFRDEDLLKELIKHNAREPTDDELQAGDLNGDGTLDHKDWLLLKQLLAGKSLD